MTLLLTDEQRMLRDAARRFLQEKAPVAEQRKLRDSASATGFSRALWREMAEMGWVGIAIPEEYGGSSFGYTSLGLILEELGRTLTASPMISTALLGATALIRGGNEVQRRALLPKIAAGDLIVTLAIEEGWRHAPDKVAFEAEEVEGGYRLKGHKTFVLDGHVADKYLVVARTAAARRDRLSLSLFLVENGADGLAVERTVMVDARNSAHLRFSDVTVSRDALVGELNRAVEIVQQVLDIAQIGLSAELLGICQQAFEMTLAYLKERRQFGVAIGSFQALQHRAAQMFCEIELCKSAVLKGLQAIDANSADLPRLASLIKAKVCETATRVTNEAIQMHGGIGMTDEFDIGFFLKRARAAQFTFGDYHYHLDRYARLSGF